MRQNRIKAESGPLRGFSESSEPSKSCILFSAFHSLLLPKNLRSCYLKSSLVQVAQWAIQVKHIALSRWNSRKPTAAVERKGHPRVPAVKTAVWGLVTRTGSLEEVFPGKHEANSGNLLEIVEDHSE